LGELGALSGRNLALRKQQYDVLQMDGVRLALARAVVGGKLRNYLTYANRVTRAPLAVRSPNLQLLVDAIESADRATSVDSLRGIEGTGTRIWFSFFRNALQNDLGFARRERRPPPDPVNALLSLGYTMLAHACRSACEIVGLDPYDGFYHTDRYGRPSLALDLMEEFRAVIVDSVVLNLINREMLKARDFVAGPEGGVVLRTDSMRVFFRRYSARLQQHIKVEGIDRPMTYQKILELQARKIRRVIEGETTEYTPYLTR